jgi:hypothetical protein
MPRILFITVIMALASITPVVLGYNFFEVRVMNTRVTRHDLSYLLSVGLLVVAAVAGISGLIADLWDLNEFVYHKYAGYTLALMALAHVYLRWGRLVAYIRWRLRRHPKRRRPASLIAKQRTNQQRKAQGSKKVDQDRSPGVGSRKLLSRRSFIPLTLGGLGGLALGRLLRSEPELPFGGDVGTIYHWGFLHIPQ